jgi:flagella basal body P-ring formation protein FlgA
MSFALALIFVAAAPFADLDAVDSQVAHFTGAGIGQPGGAAAPADRRLRLQPCRTPLQLGWHGPRRDTVVVQCPDMGSWRLYVPINGGGGGGQAALPAVNRGDAVTIAVKGPGFTVSQPGEAMEGGAVGAWIKVRTVSVTPRPGATDAMRAQIVRPGLVSIPLE